MASEIDICNLSLSVVGVSQLIAARDEGSAESDACDLWFDACRDMALQLFDWDFARQYSTLGLVATDPNTDWGYAYRYPVNCLKARSLMGTARTAAGKIPWALGLDASGRLIYTDAEDAVLRMTVRIVDTELFDPLMTDMLVGLLAVRIASPLSRSKTQIADAKEYYNAALNAAVASAGDESGRDPEPDAESIQVRS